jgi:hypothetical protein
MTIRTNEKLWKKVVSGVKRSNKGGKPGQWSARKAQLAVFLYKKKNGKYRGEKSRSNSLSKWTKQRWRTRSGRNSVVGKNATGERYLPSGVIRKLSKKQYNYTTMLKRKSIKKGEQYSRNSSKARKAVRKRN